MRRAADSNHKLKHRDNSGKLSPTERVSLAADMTSAATEIMLENIRSRNPGITKRKLLEKARERMFKSVDYDYESIV